MASFGLLHKYDDELFKSSGAADMIWNPEEILEQAATSLFDHFVPNSSFSSNLDELASIMSCKMTSSAPIPAPGTTLDALPELDSFDLLNYVLDDCLVSPLDELEAEVAQVAMPAVIADVCLSSSLESNPSPINEMRHHDCMWSGVCRHEEHGDADLLVTPPSSPTGFPDACPKSPACPTKPAPLRPVNSRSLLMPRKDIASKFASKLSYKDIVGHRPETPVSDFDESFQSIHAAYSANEDEDSETDSIQSSSETEIEDCLDEEVTPVVDSRYVNHGTSYITDHTYGRPAPYRQPDTNNYGLCTPSDSEEEIDVVSLQPSKTPEISSRLIEEEQPQQQQPKLMLQQRPPTKRSKLTPTKRSARQSARAARESTLTSKRNSQSHDFQEELHQSLAAMAAEAAKEVVPPLRLRLPHGGKRRKSALATPPTSSSGSSSCCSSDSSSDDAAPAPKRGVKRSRMSKKINQAAAASRKRSAAAAALSARSSSDSEDRSGKRTMHNTMERQRRVDLRTAFETLRQYVPPLLNSEKAPKVTILREAANFCIELHEEEQRLERQRNALLKEQAALRQRLAHARRTHAHARR